MSNVDETQLSIAEILATAESEVSETTSQITKAEDSAAAANKRRMGLDRSVIAWSIIAVYAITVIILVLYVVVRSPGCGISGISNVAVFNACIEASDGRATLLLSVITTAVLPIVTLMLGFYFGVEKAEKAAQGD